MGFSRVIEDDWWFKAKKVLEILHRIFEVVHLHANNFSPWAIIGNVPFPDVVEVTYANRIRYHFKQTGESFPTPIDAPNDPTVPDMFIGHFEMWPPPQLVIFESVSMEFGSIFLRPIMHHLVFRLNVATSNR